MTHSADPGRIAPLMGRLWAPLASVTTRWQDKTNAQIAVSIAAASIVPARPRIVIQIYKGNYSHQLIQKSLVFAVNFLRQDQLHLVKAFGFVSGRHQDKLAGVARRTGASGSPILTECWGYLDCRVVNAMDGGDMTCFLAEVLEGDVLDQGEPLWWRNARRMLPPAWAEEWEQKLAGEMAASLQRMGDINYSA
ncbi:MAG: flavin reductase family protein [SAR202 cluster bacterium]|nr:flavin reductase family protein [SAR202 cluster bacterium]